MSVMQVESYEQTEEYDGEPEDRDEAFALTVELGLNGQGRFFSPSDGDMPFRKMTDEEYRVYEAVLGAECELKDYKDDPIPVRILQIAAKAQPHFKELRVMYAPNADDPVLYGRTEKYEKFIIARWGSALKSFGELRVEAGKVIKAKYLKECRKGIAGLEAAMAAIEGVQGEDVILGGFKAPYVTVY